MICSYTAREARGSTYTRYITYAIHYKVRLDSTEEIGCKFKATYEIFMLWVITGIHTLAHVIHSTNPFFSYTKQFEMNFS